MWVTVHQLIILFFLFMFYFSDLRKMSGYFKSRLIQLKILKPWLRNYVWNQVCISCGTHWSFLHVTFNVSLLSTQFSMICSAVLPSLSQLTPLLVWGGCRQTMCHCHIRDTCWCQNTKPSRVTASVIWNRIFTVVGVCFFPAVPVWPHPSVWREYGDAKANSRWQAGPV